MQNRPLITMRSPLNPNRRLPPPVHYLGTPHRPACRAAANTGSADLRTAGPQAAAEARARRAAESELNPDLELCATRTIKISRADLEQAMAAQQAAKQQEQLNPNRPLHPEPEPLPEPEPKLLSWMMISWGFFGRAGPAALEAARKADESPAAQHR